MLSFLNLSQKKLKKLQKVFSCFSILSLVLQISSGIFLYQPVIAQEVTPTPTPTVTIEPTPIPTETPAITSSPEPEITPEITPTPDITPTPEITPEPSATPELTNSPQPSEAPKPETTSPNNQPQAPPEETASSTPQVQGDQKENGHLSVVILEETKAASIDKLDLDFQTEGSATLKTDKLDYAPTDTVLITGSGFLPNKTYTLIISSQDEPPVNFETQITTDENGNLFYSYQLDGTSRPDYKVEILTLAGELVASTTFTDPAGPAGSLVINEIDYDQTGTDQAEFIEIKNVSDGTINLDSYELRLINGSSPVPPYRTINLPNADLAAADYYIICGNAANVANCDLDVSPNENLIQNGAPNAVALYKTSPEELLVDTVSYEGDVPGYTEGTGTVADTNAAVVQGLSRYPDGQDTNNNNTDFVLSCITPGGANVNTPDCNKVTICHTTASNSNPYIVNHPDKSGDVSGHDIHNGPIWYPGITESWGDIIPPFDYDGGSYPGKNWLEGQAIWNNGCVVPTATPTPSPSPSPSPTPSPSPSPSPTPTPTPTPTPSCQEGTGWATSVVSAAQGKLKNGGTIIDPTRTDPSKTLGVNDGVFFSLGYGGTLVLSFEQWVTDADGDDLSFHETTWGRSTYPIEKAEVFVSQDNSTWKSLGEITNKDDVLGISYKDISSTGWSWIKYVKLVDTTNDPALPSNADGFDLDAVDVVYGVCEEPQPEPICGDGEINQETEQCDEGEANGQECTPEYGSSCNYCSDSCQEVTVPGPFCGDNVKNGNEQCDGTNDCLTDCTLKPVVDIDPAMTRIINGEACGVGNAWDDDGLKVNVTNWKPGYKLMGSYFIGGGSFGGWADMQTYGTLTVDGTNATLVAMNTGDSPAGPAGWEVRVVDASDNVISNTDSLNYIINSDATSQVCGGTELWWYKVESYKDTNESAWPLAASGTWTATVRDSTGASVGTVLNTNASTVDTFNKSVTYNNIKLPHGVYTLSEDVNLGYQFSWGRCMDSTDAVPYNSSFYFDVGSAEGKQQVFGPDVAGLTSDGSPWNTSTDGFAQLNLTAGKRIYCVLYNKQLTQISGMKFDDANGDGIKNKGELGLSDWTIFAGQKVWESDVQAFNTPEVTSPVLSSGTAYAIRVSNTYNAGDGITADAKYSKRAPNTGWTDYVQHYEGYGSTLLDLQINGTSPDWGSYNASHVYWQMLTGTGTTLKFKISDFYPSNDTGALHVEIYKVIAQTSTDGSGNYTFSLPDISGDIIVGEVTQNGYTQTYPMTDGYWTIPQGENATNKDFGNAPATTYGRVTFEKVVSQGDVSPNSWSFTIDGINGSFTTGQDAIIPVGTYTVTESSENDPIYRSVSVAGICSDLDTENRQATLLVTENGGTCTFTNTINTGSITVDKVTDPAGDPQSFDFNLDKDGQTFDNFSLTDSADPYSNTALLPGTYSLEESVPDGWMNDSWSCWQNDNPVSDNSEIVINAGDQVSCVFNNTKLGSIWGRKFRDTNANGERDGSSDPYLNDWTINLYDDEWGWVKGMQTGDDSTEAGEMQKGQYKFINLTPGNYYVCEELESGWMQTKPSESEGSVYEDGDGNSFCYAVELSAGRTEKGLTFGNFKLGKVQGMKYEDQDGDGLPHENGEEYLNDWTLRLYKDWGGEPIEITTSNTGQTGQYKYTDLSLGTYQVCEVLKEGWTQTWPKVGDVPVADNGTLHSEYGQAVANQSKAQDEASVCWQTIIDSSGDFNQLLRFGNTQFGSISGYKYEDMDGNGTRGEGELGLNKWTIFLDGDDDGVLDTKETSLITDDSGYYRFENLIARDYQVCETSQEGWQRTQPADSDCQSVVVNPGQETTDIDFGNFKLGEINGWKWDDYNGNGFWDEGEPALSGWEVCLSLSEEPTFRIAEQDNGNCVQTNDNGYFEFTGLRAGNYRLTETAQPGWDQTWPVDPNSYDLTIRSGTHYGGEICNGQPRVNGIVAEEIRQLFCTNFGNELQPITLTLSKTNNIFPGSMTPGGTVTYTLTVTNTSRIIARDVSVRDTLPIGFSYVVSSTTGASEPTVTGQNLVWSLGDLDPDAIMTITYQAKTDSGLQEGKYPNVALAWGYNRPLRIEGETPDRSITYTDPKWSWVSLIPGVSFSAGIGGTIQQVLGASTGQVLGAATGAETGWLILAILMILAGLALKNLSKLRKLIKILILVTPLLFGLSFAKSAQAANLTVQITTLPEYKNTPVFKLSYTALQVEGKPITAQFSYRKESGSYQDFGGVLSGETGSVETTTAMVNEQGKYYFKVVATSGGESISSETSTTIDWNKPESPTNYRKERSASNAFKIIWRNPSESDFDKVLVYRSDKRDFTADSSTLIGSRGGSPLQEMDYVDGSLQVDKEFFYAIRAIDKAGNASDLVGDGGSTTYVEVSPSPGTQSAGEIQPLPVAGGGTGGQILGQGTEGSPAAGAESQTGSQQAGTGTGTTSGILGGGNKLIWGLGGLGLLALAFFFFSRRSS